jgi:hypothetical protein
MYPGGTVVLASIYFYGSSASKVALIKKNKKKYSQQLMNAVAHNGIKDWVKCYLEELLDEIFIPANSPMN